MHIHKVRMRRTPQSSRALDREHYFIVVVNMFLNGNPCQP